MLDRCLRILQINPGMDLQKLISGVCQQDFPPELLEKVQASKLNRQDQGYVRRVFLMSMGVLARAVMDALLQPERAGEVRREMEAQMDIIKNGCLRSRRTRSA